MSKPTNRAIFIDRDGTLNKEVNYLDDPARLELLPRSIDAIIKINKSDYKAILITNQSGIARGYFPKERLSEIHDALNYMLDQKGAYLDGIYYCPHHPKDKCNCRKPASGMLDKVAAEHNISLSNSFVIGDKITDIYTAHKVNARGVLALTGYGQTEYEKDRQLWVSQPDYIADNLYNAVCWILGQN